MRHAGETPGRHPDREAAAQADAIDEPAGAEEGHRGAELERGGHVAVIAIGPAIFALQHRFQQRDDLAIDIVEHDRGKGEDDDRPSPGIQAFFHHDLSRLL